MAIDFNIDIVFGVLTFIVVLATVALSILLYGSLSSECFSCDRKKYTQALADSFFWVALSVTIVAFTLLLFTIYDTMKATATPNAGVSNTKRIMLPLGYMVVLGAVTVMAGVVMMDVKKNLDLVSCTDAGSRVSGDEGYVLFKKSKGICVAAMVLSLAVLLAIMFSLAQALKPEADKILGRFGRAYDALVGTTQPNNLQQDLVKNKQLAENAAAILKQTQANINNLKLQNRKGSSLPLNNK
jgi:hypothetical protein